jgi:DNA segregation ATPase FtsK/SpoIIIE, S-DNA-T family
MIVLIDLQARFIHYGGSEGLHKLPQVAATVVDPSELPALAQKLEAECLALENESNSREIYIIIDNFDELSEETVNTRDSDVRNAGQLLARIARRYGARGVHFIGAGGFSSMSDIGRVIMSSNYGIGLRTSSALDTLRVNRIPASLRDKEQTIGRGWGVKSGQFSMLQVATPYLDSADVDSVGDGENGDGALQADDSGKTLALDGWIREIKGRWQDHPTVSWSHLSEADKADATVTEQPVESPQAIAMRSMLERAMHWELTTPQNGDGASLTLSWLRLSRVEQGQEMVLFKLCREALIKRLRADGMPDPEVFVDLFQDADNLVMTAQDYFPEVSLAAANQNGHG